jgi:hypothetical protein
MTIEPCLADVMAPWVYNDELSQFSGEWFWQRYVLGHEEYASVTVERLPSGSKWQVEAYPCEAPHREANAQVWYCDSQEEAARMVVNIMEAYDSCK